jgi:hypothetical protein
MNESLIAAWLALPDWQIFLSLIVGYLTTAAIMH